MPVISSHSLTAQALEAKFARRQQRYRISYVSQIAPSPPRPPPPARPEPARQPERQEAASPFPAWRAAAVTLDLSDGEAGDAPGPAARGAAPATGVAAPSRRTLRDALLGTTAMVLLGVVGGIGYFMWSGVVPGAAAPGGTAPRGNSFAAVIQPFVNLAAKAGAHLSPDRTAAPPAAQDVVPAASLPPPSAAPDRLALAAPSADKPALPVPSMAAGSPAAGVDAVPVPGRTEAEPAARAKRSEPDAAPPAPALPSAPAETVPVLAPGSEQAMAAVVLPAKVAMSDATPPAPAVPARPAPDAEQAAAEAVPPAKPSEPDAAPAVPAMASVTVRLSPAPEWTTVPPVALVSLPEPAALPPAPPALPAVPASPVPPAGPAAVPDAAAKAVPSGVDAQQVVSTMTLVRQMSLLVHDMHDEGLRYRTEVTALTGAVQAKASSLEERLKLAEARSGAGPDAGGSQAGLPASDAPPVLRGYRVQAGSPGAAVLSDEKAGSERAARLLVMVGDQVPGAGRVTAIVQRGRAWLVRTERGVIQ